ncbi:MAG TPA: type II secretion system F family protein, partial [Nitrospirota bacterium]|nr:type II secretion system F family protein [Nitrospirota bacterium]
MATTVYMWEGKNRQGAVQKGEIAASSKDEVLALLKRQNIQPINVAAKAKQFSFSFGAQKIEDKDKVIFTRQLATMIDAGLPLVQCLDILGSQTENKSFGKIVIQVRTDVEGGSTFAEALKKHPKAYDNLYVNMVAAGEAGGILDTILQRLAAYMEKLSKIKKQIKSAMIYPSVILFVAVSVVALLMVVVVPMLAGMFASMGQLLPLPTRIVIEISNFLKSWGGVALAGCLVGIFIGIKQWRKTEAGLR